MKVEKTRLIRDDDDWVLESADSPAVYVCCNTLTCCGLSMSAISFVAEMFLRPLLRVATNVYFG